VKTDPLPCTVYGDLQTCADLRAEVGTIAARSGLQPIAWHADPAGLRGMPGPASAAGLAEALAHCAATGTALLIPYAADAPGEQALRLIAQWLDRHGLQLFVGHYEYVWSRPTDELDSAMRRQLDAASDLALAVAVSGGMADLDNLVAELLLRGSPPEPALAEARRIARRCDTAGDSVPAEPAPAEPWPARQAATVAYARWLPAHRSQAFLADVLNELGVRTRSGRQWSRPAISRLINPRVAKSRSAAA
jgi:hypothetical protein